MADFGGICYFCGMLSSSFGSDFISGFSETSLSAVSNIEAGFSDENICGEGFSCVVYRMNLGGLRVAVKRMRKELCSRPGFPASYRKEFQIGLQLKHDALPIYREFHEELDEVYIVMEYIDGLTHDEFIRSDEGREYFRSPENVRRFLTELTAVLGYLHRRGVIHCDLKPANIMLRHSDRAVMLLDLDKSYCDVMEKTHGGTYLMSDPLANDETPTVNKDFLAVGRIIEFLAENVPGFPASRFRRFSKACRRADATDETLLKALRHKSYAKYLWLAIAGIGISVITYLFTVRHNETRPVDIPARANDTVVSVTPAETSAPPEVAAPVATVQAPAIPAAPDQPTIDFDAEMRPFINYAQSALDQLKSSNLSDAEIRDMLYNLHTKYYSAYTGVLQRTRQKYPDMPGTRIQQAVADACEKSRAIALFQQVGKAASDSISNRHPQTTR